MGISSWCLLALTQVSVTVKPLSPSLLIIAYFSLYSMVIVFLSKIAPLLSKQFKEMFNLVRKEHQVPSRIHDQGSVDLRCTFHIVPKGGAFV